MVEDPQASAPRKADGQTLASAMAPLMARRVHAVASKSGRITSVLEETRE